MLNRLLSFAAALCAAVLIVASPASAELHVTVDQANPQPLPIAIPDFAAPNASDTAAGQNIAKVIRADLERSGLFRTLDPKSFIDKAPGINAAPNFANWRTIQAQALVAGQVQMQPDGRLRVDFRLWDVFGESQMLGQQYFTTPDNWRRIAHIISDAIYERITGEKGYFDTRIVFISESGPALHRVRRLAVRGEGGAEPGGRARGEERGRTPRGEPTAQRSADRADGGSKPRGY